MDHSTSTSGAVRELPPLILHPFSDDQAPERLTMSARASLILHGLLPAGESSEEELLHRLLDGRYQEVKMLYYLGKDISRWMEQCMEVVLGDKEARTRGIELESFALYLVEDAPVEVREKLQRWGVADHPAIFRRALGLHAVFAAVPDRESLPDAFLRHHHQYADCLFDCRLRSSSFVKIHPADFHFEVYASGEYARLLERQWGGI